MDGVIIDSHALHEQAWRLYLSQHDLPADSMWEHMHGKRNDQIVRAVFGSHLSDVEVFRHGAGKESLYRALMQPRLMEHLVPGVRFFLERHKQRLLAVASNAEPANVDFVLDGAGLRHYFRAVVDGHQVRQPKPDPEIYIKTARLLGVDPSDCVVFEDSPGGIQSAQSAGARVVAVKTTPAELPSTDYEIRDFRDSGLEQWLRGAG
jgi:HAD superfamily hydrolase (TIGR01509 family)